MHDATSNRIHQVGHPSPPTCRERDALSRYLEPRPPFGERNAVERVTTGPQFLQESPETATTENDNEEKGICHSYLLLSLCFCIATGKSKTLKQRISFPSGTPCNCCCIHGLIFRSFGSGGGGGEIHSSVRDVIALPLSFAR